MENINKKVFNELLKEAKKDKEWALNKQNDTEWLNMASDMSKDMLKERLELSIEQLAKNSYDYLKLRAHEACVLYGVITPIDPEAKRKWEKLSGKEIIYEKKVCW